ncbi:cytochrome P450 [Streptomyces sp. NPDC054786]
MTDLAHDDRAGTEPRSFPLAQKCPFQHTPEYARLRAEEPVSKVRLETSDQEAWAVASHDLVKQVLSSPHMSSDWRKPGYPLQVALSQEILDNLELPLLALDAPDHTVRRRLLLPEFTVKRMQALRPRIQEIVDECVDRMLEKGGPVDLVQELAVPVPTLLFAELMGAPAEDVTAFRDHAEGTMTRGVKAAELDRIQLEMEAHLDALVTKKEKNPTDDLLSRIILKNKEDGQLEHHDMVAIARMLLFGGFDTAANMISLGTVTLLQHPEQFAEIKQDPTLTPKAIGELLRYLSINDSASGRVATADVQLGDVTVRKGEGVVLLYGSANRDETVFEDADTFDIHRDTHGHVSFGGGIHQCLGASLVKVELEIVFNTLFRRIPGLRLAVPFKELSFKDDTLIYGMYECPVTW